MALMKSVALNVVDGKVRANIIKTDQMKMVCRSGVRNVHTNQPKNLLIEYALKTGG